MSNDKKSKLDDTSKGNLELVKSQSKKPTKGRGGNSNFPNAKFSPETDEDEALVHKLLKETYVAYKKERVKSDEELKSRLDEYFIYCADNGVTPTVEEMCMYTGYTSSTCYDWEVGRNKGFSQETSTIIKKAKEFLKTFDAKLVVAGKLNFLAYCFRAKNYYGMADKQEVVIAASNPLGDQVSAEDLNRKYIENVYGDSATIIDAEAASDN